LTGRTQQRMKMHDQRAERQRGRETVYVEFLAAHRQFRRFLMTENVSVTLVVSAEYPEPVPVIDGAGRYWESAEMAYARVQLVAGGTAVDKAARAVRACSVYGIARARAHHGPGSVPRDVVRSARDAEDAFVEAAQMDLTSRP